MHVCRLTEQQIENCLIKIYVSTAINFVFNTMETIILNHKLQTGKKRTAQFCVEDRTLNYSLLWANQLQLFVEVNETEKRNEEEEKKRNICLGCGF